MRVQVTIVANKELSALLIRKKLEMGWHSSKLSLSVKIESNELTLICIQHVANLLSQIQEDNKRH